MDTPVQSSVRAQRIQAIGLTVTDIDRSINFYTKALNFEVSSDITAEEESADPSEEASHSSIRVVTLKLGDERIRLMQYLDKQGKLIPQDSQSNDRWFQHLAIVVSDMDCAYSHLQFFPIEPISTAPQTIPPGNKEAADIQAFKFRDPDRHPLELIWFPPTKGQEKWHQKSDRLFLGIDHTAITITNTEQSLQFYLDDLGMQVDGGSFNWRETQARMDGVPNAKVRISALRLAQQGVGIELLDYIEPANGRPIPSDLNPYDIAYMQIELIVNQVNNQFHHSRIQYTPQDSNQAEDSLFLNHPGYRIKDPTGHALLLIPQQH
jgi:catechol 2,3-dioxygenase-like lactoylglutathione lyase family enzyme